MAKKSSQRYLSGRVKITKNVSLSTDRHLYVEPGEVEPNLGYPGEKDVPLSDTYYRLITIPNGTVYDRYWQEDSPAELVEGISIFDESVLVGTANSISKIDFIGAAVSATANVGGSIATVTVYAPGTTGQVIFNQNNDFSGATKLFYDSSNERVGIGTSIPTELLHLDGNFRISGNIIDQNSVVGVANSILIATGTGVSWTSSVASRVDVGPTPPGNAQQGDLWLDSEEGDLSVYYTDDDSSQWVSANANSQSSDSFWELDEVGIHTTVNVGVTNANLRISGVTTTGGLKVSGFSTFVNSVELDSTIIDIFGNIGSATSVLRSTGAGVFWDKLGGANVYIGDSAPSDPESGDLWWESDTGELSIRYEDADSEQWVTITPGVSTFAVPTGGIILWSGAANAIPTGWVLCDNSTAAQNAGAPDLRDKFIIGAGNSYNVDDTGTSATGTGGIQYYSLCYIMKS